MLQVSVFHDMSTVTLIVNEKDAAYVLANTWLLHLETFYAVLSDSLCHLADQF